MDVTTGNLGPDRPTPNLAPAPAAEPLRGSPPSYLPMTAHRRAPLTRPEMERIVQGGEGVLYNGRVLTHLDHLPHEAELAARSGDPAREQDAARNLSKQIEELRAQLSRLEQAGPVKARPAAGPGPEHVPGQTHAPSAAALPPVGDAAPLAPEPRTDVLTDDQQQEILRAQRQALLTSETPPAAGPGETPGPA